MEINAEVNVNWYTMKNDTGKKVPAHLITAGITDDKKVYISAAIAGNERRTLMNALWEGISYIQYLGHAFLPLEWLMKEEKEIAELLEKIKSKTAFIIEQESKVKD